MAKEIKIPEFSLVVLVGPSGSGKSTFARKHFLPTEVISSDFCRALVCDDENNQEATQDAFEVLHFLVGKRLERRKLVAVDATNVQAEARKPLMRLAREHDCLLTAIVLKIPEAICRDRNASRPDRQFGDHVIRNQSRQLRRSLRGLKREGFRSVTVLESPEEVDAATIVRQRLWNDRTEEHGPFDIIGDIHGCGDELRALFAELGYRPEGDNSAYRHPEGRKAVFVGDLADRGPDVPGVFELAMAMVESGDAFCVPGNHDIKLMRKLKGRDVQITHGLAESLAQLEGRPDGLRQRIVEFIEGLVSHYLFDGGKLVVAHAGMKESYQGRASGRVREFAIYGETTGERDEYGLPVRYPWAEEYRGQALVVYGHTPIVEPEWLNNTINIDTGCVFGGRLTALRYPERELVSVPAAKEYYEPLKPTAPEPGPALTQQQQQDELLDIEDVSGKRFIQTRLKGKVTVREENATAALEVMSRFATNPKWLIYLPPTMSPCETSTRPEFLEYPSEAFAYFRTRGVASVVCEEKHMGSRAVVVLCRDEDTAAARFGVEGEGIGVVYTRTGRRFFDEERVEAGVLQALHAAIDRAGLWKAFDTDWFCLDCELMPWSAKAQALLRSQYAATGAAARTGLSDAVAALRLASGRGIEAGELLARYEERERSTNAYVGAYRRYCWPVEDLADIRIAPFHILATEGQVHSGKDHVWHMEQSLRLCEGSEPLLFPTAFRKVDLTDAASEEAATEWWLSLTEGGGEGMVVKPLEFVVRDKRGLLQPAVKCRGREYLRIIYGPEYTEPSHMENLRKRSLGRKRSLAVSEFALGIEALERFVRREPLRRVHECVFGVLAMESEPVDPRL